MVNGRVASFVYLYNRSMFGEFELNVLTLTPRIKVLVRPIVTQLIKKVLPLYKSDHQYWIHKIPTGPCPKPDASIPLSPTLKSILMG
jgi:hypothetical protein